MNLGFLNRVSDARLRSGITECSELLDSGLRNHAAECLKETMEYFDTLDEGKRREFEDALCSQMSENHSKNGSWWTSPRQLPQEVSRRLESSLKDSFERGEMPRSRWYCELFDTSLESAERVYKAHPEDSGAARLFFSGWLHLLGTGAHHLPDSCLITRAQFDHAVAECEGLIASHQLSESMKEEFFRLKRLYITWYSWNGTGGFSDYFKKVNPELKYEKTLGGLK